MATVITEECINCGACEPECPNTAIYQGGVEYDGVDGAKHAAVSADLFYIVPEKCTECVGFFDAEACAAVCPVDCCVPDPNIPETEELLFARAKDLHPEEAFAEDFPSRFKASAAAPEGAGEAEAAAAAPAAAAPAGGAPAVTVLSPEEMVLASFPALDDWSVPLTCFRCSGKFEVPFQFIKPGTVLHCPHCGGSFVPNTSMYQNIARQVVHFYDQWTARLEKMRKKHQDLLDLFEENLHTEFAKLKKEVDDLSEDAELAGSPQRNRGFFG